MKSEYFLALPALATVINVLAAMILHTSHSHAQPVLQEVAVDPYLHALDSDHLRYPILVHEMEKDETLDVDDDDEDPMLQTMPGMDFKAYVRADIATFYRQQPGTMKEMTPAFNGQAGKFVNMSPDHLTIYWVGPSGPVLNGDVEPWSAGGTACFPDHEFIFTRYQQPDQVLCRFTITPGTSVYYCDPFAENDPDDPAHATLSPGAEHSLESLSEEDRDQYDAHRFNLEFGALYKNFTGGSEWLSMYPRERPRHKIYRADYFGQEHHVLTQETQFTSLPDASHFGHHLSLAEMSRDASSPHFLAQHRAPGYLNLTVKAVSCAPRAFEVRNFLSDLEVDHLLDLVHRQRLERSTTNGHTSDTRTSTTTWLSRSSDPVLNAILRRIADVLGLDEALLRQRRADEYPDLETSQAINEDLQIVHYAQGQQYTAHHDFGYPDGEPGHPSRSINFCMYLNNVTAGGQTSFPRWRNAETNQAIDVVPEKGKAMIFYMVNPDGNLDDLTQHAALPVLEGEKYFSNLWIHDPYRS